MTQDSPFPTPSLLRRDWRPGTWPTCLLCPASPYWVPGVPRSLCRHGRRAPGWGAARPWEGAGWQLSHSCWPGSRQVFVSRRWAEVRGECNLAGRGVGGGTSGPRGRALESDLASFWLYFLPRDSGRLVPPSCVKGTKVVPTSRDGTDWERWHPSSACPQGWLLTCGSHRLQWGHPCSASPALLGGGGWAGRLPTPISCVCSPRHPLSARPRVCWVC